VHDEKEESKATTKKKKEPNEFEKSLDLEKHGYTPSIFHALFPIFGLAYH